MFDVKKMIEEIAAKKEIKNVSFVGCGGSLACFFAPHYYVCLLYTSPSPRD